MKNYKEILLSYNGNILSSRFAAYVIDSIILFVISAIMYTIKPDIFIIIILYIITFMLYFVLFEAFTGRTIGKLIVGIKVTNAYAQNPGIKRALLRNFIKLVEGLPIMLIASLITMLINQYKQRPGDIVSGTFTIANKDLQILKPYSEDEYTLESDFTINSKPITGLVLSLFCLIFILFTLFTVYVTKNESKTSNKILLSNEIVSLYNTFTINSPKDWIEKPLTGNLDEYIMVVHDWNKENYLYVVEIIKEDTYNEALVYCHQKISELNKSNSKKEDVTIYNQSINGYNAFQFEMKSKINDGETLQYYFTIIDTPTKIYQLAFITEPYTFERTRDKFFAIANSFKLNITTPKYKSLLKEDINALVKLNKINDAFAVYNAKITDDRQNAELYYKKAGLLLRYGEILSSIYAINSALKYDPDNEKYQLFKAKSLIKYGYYDKGKKILDQIKTKSGEYYNVYGLMQYYKEKYAGALKTFDRGIKKAPSNIELYTNKAMVYVAMDDNTAAKKLCQKAISINPDNSDIYKILGNIDMYDYKYKSSLLNFNKSISKDTISYYPYLDKAELLYYKKNYNECIKFCQSSLKLFPHDYDLYLYLADSYAAMQMSDKALDVYKSAYKSHSDEYICYSLAYQYYLKNDTATARKYIEEALKLYPEYEQAKALQKEINNVKQTQTDKLIKFVKDNYLYYDKIKNINLHTKNLKKNVFNSTHAQTFINKIKLSEDQFTVLIDGKYYDMLKKMDEENYAKLETVTDNLYYLNIGSFTLTTGTYVIESIEKIKNPESSNLIIDLRDNTGGLIQPATDILDLLLPKCTTSYTVTRDGTIDQYTSDPYQIKFKNIIIFVNENSASSSELLTLGLKKFLPNVKVIGRPTYGKGVGQIVYDDPVNKFYLYLVNFHWNVKEENISKSKIIPDIRVKTNNDNEYITAAKKIIS